MSDLISRSAAIEAIEKHIRTAEEPYQLTDADKVMNHAFEIAASCVYNLSAAQPERKRGRWLDGYKRQTCSLCKGKGVRSWNYCPYCGADMREVSE